jgi:hypothetical protein
MRPQTRKEPRKLLKMANQRQELQPVTDFLEFIRNKPLCWQDQQDGNPALRKYFDYQQTLTSYLRSESEVGEYLRRLDAAVRVWQMACGSHYDNRGEMPSPRRWITRNLSRRLVALNRGAQFQRLWFAPKPLIEACITTNGKREHGHRPETSYPATGPTNSAALYRRAT